MNCFTCDLSFTYCGLRETDELFQLQQDADHRRWKVHLFPPNVSRVCVHLAQLPLCRRWERRATWPLRCWRPDWTWRTWSPSSRLTFTPWPWCSGKWRRGVKPSEVRPWTQTLPPVVDISVSGFTHKHTRRSRSSQLCEDDEVMVRSCCRLSLHSRRPVLYIISPQTLFAPRTGLRSENIFRDRPLRCMRWINTTKEHDMAGMKAVIFSKYNNKLESIVHCYLQLH